MIEPTRGNHRSHQAPDVSGFCLMLLRGNSQITDILVTIQDRLFESFSQVFIRFERLVQLFVFAPQ